MTMPKYSSLAVLAIVAMLGAGCAPSSPATGADTTSDTSSAASSSSSSPNSMDATPTGVPDALSAEELTDTQVRITTNKGDIVVQLYPDTAPVAASNFVTLATKGYYDGVIFHRVIEGFMIQGGDPTGTGRGGPGYQFADELDDARTYTRGTLAMANSGPDTNGSQFFIMHKDYPLPHNYTIFGFVTEGMDVVDAIATAPRDRNDRPLTDIVMERVTVADVE